MRSMQRLTNSWNAILLRQAPQSSHGYKVAANLLLHTSEDSMKSQGSAGHLSTEKLSAWCQQKSPHHGFYCINIISPTLAPLFYNGSHVLRVATLTMRSFLTALPCSLYPSLLGSNTLSPQLPKNPHTKYFLTEYYSTNPHGSLPSFHIST